MNEEIMKQLPFDLTIYNLICYEATGKPIILKNGAKMHPKGWLKFFKITEEDIEHLLGGE